MPSSSTRSTEQEKSLLHFYKLAYARLYASNMRPQAHFLLLQFAELLDMSESEMWSALKPKYDKLHPISGETFRAEMKFWQQIDIENRKMRNSDKICSAGNALADTGATLFKFGREAEGAKFCDWGEELWGMAYDAAYDEEERRLRFYRGVTDIDMG